MENQTIEEVIKDFLERRPSCDVVIGYGSHVIKQEENTDLKNNQIDLLLGVSNSSIWHKENILINPFDYTDIERKRFNFLSREFLDFFTGINFLTYISHKSYKFKLGVFDVDKVKNDLVEGNTFYLVGRLSKPKLIIKSTDEFNDALLKNQMMSLWIGSCLTGHHGLVRDLYINIAGFSYRGDIRNGINIGGNHLLCRENPNKVRNLVDGNKSAYDELYHYNNEFISFINDEVIINIRELLREAYTYLPMNMYQYLKQSIANEDYEKTRALLIKYLESKNFRSSLIQAIKGLMTIDFQKTKMYLKSKANKARGN